MPGLGVASPTSWLGVFARCGGWYGQGRAFGTGCVLGTFMAEDSDVHSAVSSSAWSFVCHKCRDQSASVKGIKILEVEGSPS